MVIMSLWEDNIELYKCKMSDLIINKTCIEAVNDFNRLYGLQAINICPELYNITINAVYHDDSQHLSELNLNSNDAFAYFFYYEAPPKIAEIVINEEVLLRQGMENEDILAAIAHEIGHIISIENHGDCFKELAAEILSDDYACKIGLRNQLILLLKKMKDCGEYSDFQLHWLEKRIDLLERFPVVNDIATIAKMTSLLGEYKS